MMRHGPDEGPVVTFALPLFEEANRTRVVAVAIMRALAVAGVATVLPDLPGQGDSLVPTEAVSLIDLREAFAAATQSMQERPVHVAAIRSGALLDLFAPAHGRWHWSPQDGPALLNELRRMEQQQVGREWAHGEQWVVDASSPAGAPNPPVSIAGNLLAPGLLSDLTHPILFDALAVPTRVVRLDGDPRPADRYVPGAPPWRRAEPGGDDALAQTLASDISDWVATCGAR